MCRFRWDEESLPEQWAVWMIRIAFAVVWFIAFGYAIVCVLPAIFEGPARWRVGP